MEKIIRTKKSMETLKFALSLAKDAADNLKDAPDNGKTPPVYVLVNIRMSRRMETMFSLRFAKCIDERFKDWMFVDIPLQGRGNRRQSMCQAAVDVLNEYGFESVVYDVSAR